LALLVDVFITITGEKSIERKDKGYLNF